MEIKELHNCSRENSRICQEPADIKQQPNHTQHSKFNLSSLHPVASSRTALQNGNTVK